MRTWRRLLAIGSWCLGCVSTPPPAVELEAVEPPPAAPTKTPSHDRAAILRLYDEAGFPDVSGLPLVRRTVATISGSPACDAGVLVPYGTETVLLRSDLVTEYDGVLIDQIPQHMRLTEPRNDRVHGWIRTARASRRQPEPLPHVGVRYLPPAALRHSQLDEPTLRPCAPLSVGGPIETLVRARWAQMKGLPEEVPLPAQLGATAYRDRLCDHLFHQAQSAYYQWLPRSEVRALLKRAARVCSPSDRVLAELWLERIEPLDSTAKPGSPEALVALLPDRKIHFERFERVRASWDVQRFIRDPALELYLIGRPAVPALMTHLGDMTPTRAGSTVGRIARTIVGRIAREDFKSDQEVRVWWAEVQ